MAITAAKLLISVGADSREADQALTRISQKIDGFGTTAMNVGRNLTAWVTTPLLGIGAAATHVAADFDRNMNVLQATSGATAGDMEKLRKQAMELGADLTLPGASAGNAAEAMLELSKAGLDVNETLAASRGVLQLAAAGQLSNAQAAEIAANALNAFGLEGSEAIRVADLLAAAANASSGDVTDMADSLKMASAVANSARIPIEDVVTAISLMANAGIKGSDAGTSLKQMLLALQAPSVKASKTLKELGISIYDAQGNMLPMPDLIAQFSTKLGGLTQQQRNMALATIFGSDAVRAANVILMGGVEAYDAMKEAVTDAGAAADLAAAQTEGLGGVFGKLKSSLTNAMVAGVMPFKDEIVNLADSITKAITAFSNLDEGTQEAIVGFGLLAAAAGPATWAIGAVTRAVGVVVGVIGGIVGVVKGAIVAWQAWQAGLSLTTALGAAGLTPLAITIGAIALAVGAVAAVWYTWNEQITKTNQEGAKAISDQWTTFFNNQVESGKNAIQVVDEYLKAQQSARDALNSANPILRLFITNQQELTESYGGLSTAAAEAATNYSEYEDALRKAADANGLVIDSEGNLIQLIQTQYGVRRKMVQENYLLTESEFDLAQSVELVNKAIYDGTKGGTAYSGAANDVGVAVAGMEQAAAAAADAVDGLGEALDEAVVTAMDAADIMSILDQALSDAGWSSDAITASSQDLEVALGTVTEAQAQLRNDVTLLAQAYAEGVISGEEYTQFMIQAKEGTLELSDAQRENYDASIKQAEGLREAAQAAIDAQIHQMDLERTFSEVWTNAQERYQDGVGRIREQQAEIQERIAELQQKAREAAREGDKQAFKGYIKEIKELQTESNKAAGEIAKLADEMQRSIEMAIASTAMSELNKAYQGGAFEGREQEYIDAVKGISEKFGLVNQTGIEMAAGVTMLTKALTDGQLPGKDYAQLLKDLAVDAGDGVVDLNTFRDAITELSGAATTAAPLVTTAANTMSTGITDASTTAQSSLTNLKTSAEESASAIVEAFTAPDWVGLGEDVGAGIAEGIRGSISDIETAATDAAAAALAAAQTESETQSPSLKFKELGANWMAGAALGVREGAGEPIRETISATRRATDAAQTSISAPAGVADGQFVEQIVSALAASRGGGSGGMAQITINVGGEELRRVIVSMHEQELAV